MEKPNVEKESPNPQTTNPETIDMENPKEEKPTQNPQTVNPIKTTEMENPKEPEKTTQNPQTMEKFEQPKTTKHVFWDCESSLYDSFELKSFQKQLDSAISSRSLSMPHLSHHELLPPPQPSHQKLPSKKPSKISRSLHKFFRSVFQPKQSNNKINNNNEHNSKKSSRFRVEKGSREGVYYVYDTSGSLTTIPEAPETVGDFDGLSPDLKSFVTRTASDRFAPASLGISCA